ncbi:HAD-IIA family hydrolase [Marinoscillum sp.]|uniref:HAD-IIA family hydrolase n=1 Tax=Marinoscillum sp. TaxID=2024838 RepID=UPI003BAB976C
MDLTSFKSIVDQYETIFFDAFGVLKNHKGLIPDIKKTFDYLEERGINYFILTNDASRGPRELAQSYQDKGLHHITMDKIVSSGMLAREYLKHKVKSGTIAYLGTFRSAHYIETLGLDTLSIAHMDLSQADEISAMVFLDDEGFDWYHDLNKAVNLLRFTNVPAIVSNTDLSYPMDQKQVAIAVGGIANMVESVVGKRFIRFGKPDAQMFIFAHEHSIALGGTSDKDKILMVGDTLTTDIIGGNKFGLDTVLVLTGNTLPKHADMMIETSGIVPTYLCESAVV